MFNCRPTYITHSIISMLNANIVMICEQSQDCVFCGLMFCASLAHTLVEPHMKERRKVIVVPVNRVLPTIPLIADLTQSLPKLDIDIFNYGINISGSLRTSLPLSP